MCNQERRIRREKEKFEWWGEKRALKPHWMSKRLWAFASIDIGIRVGFFLLDPKKKKKNWQKQFALKSIERGIWTKAKWIIWICEGRNGKLMVSYDWVRFVHFHTHSKKLEKYAYHFMNASFMNAIERIDQLNVKVRTYGQCDPLHSNSRIYCTLLLTSRFQFQGKMSKPLFFAFRNGVCFLFSSDYQQVKKLLLYDKWHQKKKRGE